MVATVRDHIFCMVVSGQIDQRILLKKTQSYLLPHLVDSCKSKLAVDIRVADSRNRRDGLRN